jgi:hypothetical protein
LPLLTAQNLHERVQTLPSIMNVAVFREKHSAIFGQCALWHTVFSFNVFSVALVTRTSGSLLSLVRNHGGKRNSLELLAIKCTELVNSDLQKSAIIIRQARENVKEPPP